MIRMNLGQNGPSFGLAQALLPQQQQRRVVGDVDKSPQYSSSARNYGLSEALQPIEVTSGTWGEALADALAGGIRGRTARSERQNEMDTESWDQNRTDKQEAGQRMAISEALAGFDPNNPQALVQGLREQAPEQALSLAGALAGREPQEMWSEPFDQGGVQVQRSSTTNQLRPVGNPPVSMQVPQPGMPVQGAAGYVWGPNGTMTPAQGGPADRRINTEQAGRARAAMARFEDQSSVTSAIDRALELAGSGETGAVGAAMRNVPGTRAFDLDAQLDVIRANLAFDSLMEMRANSPTGGALGAVSERELLLLQSTMEALNQAQSREQFVAGLQRLRQTYQMSMARIRAAYEQDFGGGMPGPDEAPVEPNMAGEQTQPRVMQWSPERGVY